MADTPGSTDKIYGPSVRLPMQKKKAVEASIYTETKQIEMTGALVNMIASVFLRHLFVGITLVFILRMNVS